ncbi:uncharacterized protein LOC127107822 [Lathyrus oleraceus]|uniref:uncharacterized protein LOC127107822 n=1 Tax=Pisum sativum TaxID=3888 RepID=UPI0021D300AF|nr:uncharacterized protein LOC127107822 [Pisum sativum]XP_050901106.1 uncharacterized protein LOC127107822 [Pisum sativum]XP_050901107.1 uncharacterized protein LOC127107822 [Pisum sativum]XP_050901108.1 uncharacterized protein LOC127107822 [Pisum sativum]XP_050901109.1 uncharacterized protein LOC127107822 [Pisum sativum]
MQQVDYMDIVFKGKAQMRRFKALTQREMTITLYPNEHTMTKLGIRDSVMFLINQLGWDTFAIKRKFSSITRLTLEFLSSLVYLPNHGMGFNKGLITFRLFDKDYRYTYREMAELLGCPNGPDTFTITQEDILVDNKLDLFWCSITGNNHLEPDLMQSENIHNPAIRYFHKILAHTLFGKEKNITVVSKDELFIMYCVSQTRPVNAATFMIANLCRITQEDYRPISVGGLVTMITHAMGLHYPVVMVIRPMNIRFCVSTGIIRNLGPDVFEFLINSQPVHLFTLPDPRTSVHDRNNWLYDLDGPPPQIHDHHDNYLSDAESHPLVIPVAPLTDRVAAIEAIHTNFSNLRGELSTLRVEFYDFMDVVTENLYHIYQHFYSFAPPTSSRRNFLFIIVLPIY